MPRHPEIAGSLSGIGGSVFSSLTDRIRNYSGEIYPLHVGDTWLDPAEGCRMQDLTVEDHPGLHLGLATVELSEQIRRDPEVTNLLRVLRLLRRRECGEGGKKKTGGMESHAASLVAIAA